MLVYGRERLKSLVPLHFGTRAAHKGAPFCNGVVDLQPMRRLFASAFLAVVAACAKHDAPAAPQPDAGDDDTLMCDPGANAPAAAPAHPVTAPFIARVDPFIGTGGGGFEVGNAFPGPERPFGMARPGPDTSSGSTPLSSSHCSGYAHDDVWIEGFSQMRMSGTGIVDYGQVGLMPTIGMSDEKHVQSKYRQRFSHATEKASPGYYAVTLDDTKIQVELTATDHVAVHRYTFPAGSDANVIVDAAHVISAKDQQVLASSVHVDDGAHEIAGLSRLSGGYSGRFGGVPVYFVARFARAFKASGTWASGAWASFDTSAGATVEVAVGLSFVDEAHARANLDAEIQPFDKARADAEAAWEKALARIELVARDDRDVKIFYTALYHALLMPTLATDVDGSYRGIDAQVHAASGFRYYTDFSLWDTYRTLHPFLTLVYPDVQRDLVQSLLEMARAYGSFPRWPLGIGETGGMLGDSAAVVLADSLLKGIAPVDYAAAYDFLKKSANTTMAEGGRGNLDEYKQNGYIAIESAGASASKTLEYALDDAALANMADALGHPDDAQALRARAKNYAKLWDPDTGFLVGRHADGTFPAQTPLGWQDWYAEGDAWQYTFLVPHDPEGLAQVMGGKDAMLAKLEQLFTHSACKPPIQSLPWPYYWAGNEPDIFAPWMFAALDDVARTAKYTRWVAASQYGDGPDGLPGNDDAGALSAWYLFAASGFYPQAGSDVYLLGSPIFPKITMHLPTGDLVIDAPDASAVARYPTKITLAGAPLDRPRVTHGQIGHGGTLAFTMSADP